MRDTGADGYEQMQAWVCVEGCPIKALDEQAGPRRSGAMKAGTHRANTAGYRGAMPDQTLRDTYSDAGMVSRFFPTFHYAAKASPRERQAGCEDLPYQRPGVLADDSYVRAADGKAGDTTRVVKGNHHPTVKPVALMRWLVRLVTPPGGLVLDPFAGSGSTGVACVYEGLSFVGVEAESDYAEIARRRLAHALVQHAGPLFATAQSLEA